MNNDLLLDDNVFFYLLVVGRLLLFKRFLNCYERYIFFIKLMCMVVLLGYECLKYHFSFKFI